MVNKATQPMDCSRTLDKGPSEESVKVYKHYSFPSIKSVHSSQFRVPFSLRLVFFFFFLFISDGPTSVLVGCV